MLPVYVIMRQFGPSTQTSSQQVDLQSKWPPGMRFDSAQIPRKQSRLPKEKHLSQPCMAPPRQMCLLNTMALWEKWQGAHYVLVWAHHMSMHLVLIWSLYMVLPVIKIMFHYKLVGMDLVTKWLMCIRYKTNGLKKINRLLWKQTK